jgi:hypothetical protein
MSIKIYLEAKEILFFLSYAEHRNGKVRCTSICLKQNVTQTAFGRGLIWLPSKW